MATQKKTTKVEKSDSRPVSLLAAEALRKMRRTNYRLPVRLVGTDPMLMHRWGYKAFLQMLGKMVGIEMPRQPKDLTNDYNESWYRNINGDLVVPCRLVKACIVEGAIVTNKVVSKMDLKRQLRVVGHTAPIHLPEGKEMEMDVRLVRVGQTPDVRARAIIPEGWHADVLLQFPMTLSPDKVVAAMDGGGSSVGLCDFRFEKGGEFGGFQVVFFPPEEEEHHINRIMKECDIPEEQFDIPPQYLRAFNATDDETKKKAVKKIGPMRGLLGKEASDKILKKERASKGNGARATT